jgi:hypothetical protein
MLGAHWGITSNAVSENGKAEYVRRRCLDEESGNSYKSLFTIMFVQKRQRDRYTRGPAHGAGFQFPFAPVQGLAGGR